ncbi:SLA class II histocompatibility antigen, DQ haplotype D beta chain-like isoform X2 [Hypanus sabinus]|uniref:SLA class II histocompatibility antigen, DQ haplotype D beta chain-like isoform X2 n=1 Tax=Hypanus sabinus TaxID=79690 RepID=UPI0028C4F3A3|nr:SLA class II histocompatibility antigen, DQ haplotype D beta chain-like isoform X2 [Hypanus sabinus]
MRGVVAMECCTGLVSLLVTAFSLCSVAGSQTGSQGLMYFYFQSFSAPELPAFFRIVMLDDLQIDYYNSTLHEVEVKHQWIADALLTDYQKEQKEVTDRLHEFIMTHLQQLSSIVIAPEAQVLTRRPTATAGESLSCIITPFYPRAIKATWLKNGQVVSEGYKVTVLPNYNDTYWMELVIELQGNNPNIYACRVEHSSLTQALVLKGGVGEPHCAGPMLGMMTVFAIIFGVM